MTKLSTTDATKVYVTAPRVSEGTTAFWGVWVEKEDEVVWTCSADGRSIAGYIIVKMGRLK